MSKKTKRDGDQEQQAWYSARWPWLIVGGAALGLVAGMALSSRTTTAPPAAPVEPQVSEVSGAPRLAVDQTEIDEGYVIIGSPVRTTFRLSNVGDQPLKLLGEPEVELELGC